jgi:isopenicillin N synthase-like dioxygenase
LLQSRAFVRAMREFGFLYLRDHGVPRDVSATALREARRLFDEVPASDKASVALDGRHTAFRGFQALEQNVTGGVRDQHEALDVMREPWTGAPASPVLGPNLWPPSQPSLRPALEDYFRHMLRVGNDVMETIAHGLESEPGAPQLDARRWADPFWIARAIHYPRAAAPRQQGCGEHTDYGLLVSRV